jgi:hypothetical protein
VCALELYPEGRSKCRQDARMLQSCLLGGVLMAWTLWVCVYP